MSNAYWFICSILYILFFFIFTTVVRVYHTPVYISIAVLGILFLPVAVGQLLVHYVPCCCSRVISLLLQYCHCLCCEDAVLSCLLFKIKKDGKKMEQILWRRQMHCGRDGTGSPGHVSRAGSGLGSVSLTRSHLCIVAQSQHHRYHHYHHHRHVRFFEVVI